MKIIVRNEAVEVHFTCYLFSSFCTVNCRQFLWDEAIKVFITCAIWNRFKKGYKIGAKISRSRTKAPKKLSVTAVNENILIWPGKRGYVFSIRSSVRNIRGLCSQGECLDNSLRGKNWNVIGLYCSQDWWNLSTYTTVSYWVKLRKVRAKAKAINGFLSSSSSRISFRSIRTHV